MEDLLTLEHEEENKRVGLLFSIAVHLLLLLIALLPFFTYHNPPKESGILVAFGTEISGNNSEPESTISPIMEEEAESEKASETKPINPVREAPKSSKKPSNKAPIASNTTQEESPILVSKKPKEVLQETADINKEAENNAQKAIDEAKRKAEAEKKRAEAEALRKRKEAEANKKSYGNLFSSGKGNQSSSGDAGATDGGDSNILDQLSKGNGKIGGGLATRDLLYEPEVNDASQKTGKVVISVCVNPDGKVIEAEFTQKGSTTTDRHLVNKAIAGARKYKFSKSERAMQCGTISFDFKVR